MRRIGRLIGALFILYLLTAYASARLDWARSQASRVSAFPLPRPGHRIAGVVGVHTERSHDAVGSEADVADAARAAGLDFVLLTDHRSAHDPAAAWEVEARMVGGVLIVRGQEVSLGPDVGRLLVFGLDTALTGWSAGPEAFGRLLERSRATAIVAHSRSPRTRDSWRPREAPGIAGWEVFDLADIGRTRLAGPWALYHLMALPASTALRRAHHSLLRLYRDGFEGPAVASFDSAFARAQLTAVGALDAHPKRRLAGRLLPSYDPFFRTIVNHIELPVPLGRDAGAGLEAVAAGLRAGEVYISFGSTKQARNFVLAVVGADRSARMGRGIVWRPGLELRAGLVGGYADRVLYRVVKDGETTAWLRGPELTEPVHEPGAYRVEAYRYTLRMGRLFWNLRPWIFSNPIRVRPANHERLGAAPDPVRRSSAG